MEHLAALHSDLGPGPFHPYVLEADFRSQEPQMVMERGSVCLVVMKRLTGLLLALPANSIASGTLQEAQAAGPDEVLGPSCTVEVAGVHTDMEVADMQIGDADGDTVGVLLIDVALGAAEHLKPLVNAELEDIACFREGDPTYFPLVEQLVDAALGWISGTEVERIGYYSAVEEEIPLTPTPTPKSARAKPPARSPGATGEGAQKQRKKVTVATLAESMDRMAEALPALTSQVQQLMQRTDRLEQDAPASTPPRLSALRQPSGSFPSRGLLGAPPLSIFVQKMPPPRSTSHARVTLPPEPHLEREAEELAAEQDFGEQGDLARAILMQSQALTTLVNQIASSSGDPIQDLAGSNSAVSSRGAAGRAKLQQELAMQKGLFFQAVLRSMSRRMHPTLPADLSVEELRSRGVTPSQYLERYGGFGKTKDLGHIAWQVGLIMEDLQTGSVQAAQDATALLLVCLEQSAMDGGNMQIGLLLSLTEDPPQSLFSNRSLAVSSRPRAFAPTADQRWITVALQFLKELDTINRSEATATAAKTPSPDADKPNPKKKPKGGGKGKQKTEKAEEAD